MTERRTSPRRTRPTLRCAALAIVSWAGAPTRVAAAEPPSPPRPPPRELRYDLPVDVAVTAGGGALWIASELLKGELAPTTCRICGDRVPGLDDATRRSLRWNEATLPARISDVAAFGLAPVVSLGLVVLDEDARAAQRYLVDGLLVLQAVVVSSNLTQATKFVVGRERPFVAALPESEKGATARPSDNNLSFFSGHTSFAFSTVTAASTVAFMRGYRFAPYVLAAGLPIAASAGYFRIAADKHYLTDVLVGAAVGSASGFLVPWVFHRPLGGTDARALLVPTPDGATLRVVGTF